MSKSRWRTVFALAALAALGAITACQSTPRKGENPARASIEEQSSSHGAATPASGDPTPHTLRDSALDARARKEILPALRGGGVDPFLLAAYGRIKDATFVGDAVHLPFWFRHSEASTSFLYAPENQEFVTPSLWPEENVTVAEGSTPDHWAAICRSSVDVGDLYWKWAQYMNARSHSERKLVIWDEKQGFYIMREFGDFVRLRSACWTPDRSELLVFGSVESDELERFFCERIDARTGATIDRVSLATSLDERGRAYDTLPPALEMLAEHSILEGVGLFTDSKYAFTFDREQNEGVAVCRLNNHLWAFRFPLTCEESALDTYEEARCFQEQVTLCRLDSPLGPENLHVGFAEIGPNGELWLVRTLSGDVNDRGSALEVYDLPKLGEQSEGSDGELVARAPLQILTFGHDLAYANDFEPLYNFWVARCSYHAQAELLLIPMESASELRTFVVKLEQQDPKEGSTAAKLSLEGYLPKWAITDMQPKGSAFVALGTVVNKTDGIVAQRSRLRILTLQELQAELMPLRLPNKD